MHRLTVTVPEHLVRAVDARASRHGVSLGELVEALFERVETTGELPPIRPRLKGKPAHRKTTPDPPVDTPSE